MKAIYLRFLRKCIRFPLEGDYSICKEAVFIHLTSISGAPARSQVHTPEAPVLNRVGEARDGLALTGTWAPHALRHQTKQIVTSACGGVRHGTEAGLCLSHYHRPLVIFERVHTAFIFHTTEK